MNLKEAQGIVGVKADGQYGPTTSNAIAAKLKADGGYDRFADLALSENFTLGELLHSNMAVRRSIKNIPTGPQLLALFRLANEILQPVRDHYGRSVRITSGLRGWLLNKVIGGSTSSQHCHGEVADFTVQGISNKAVCIWIRDNLKYDQLIYEFGETGWIHCSYRRGRLRGDWKSAVKRGGRTSYPSRVFTT